MLIFLFIVIGLFVVYLAERSDEKRYGLDAWRHGHKN